MTQFERPADVQDVAADVPADGPRGGHIDVPAETPADRAPEPTADGSPVAAALTELDTLPQRELAEHPEVYQRIHAELQSALATIDNA